MLRTLALALTLVTSTLAVAAPLTSPLPDSEHSREWRGIEYADYLYSKLRAKYPDLKLVFDLKDLEVLDNSVPRSNLEGREHGAKYQFTENAKKAFGENNSQLIALLENGDFIRVNEQISKSVEIEQKLFTWLRSQPDDSLTPDDLMVEALRATGGHVLAAWAVAWNVTRDNWISAQTRNYSDTVAKFKSVTGERDQWAGGARYILREKLPTQPVEVGGIQLGLPDSEAKQIPLMQAVISKRGDDFSTVYHHIGVELLALVISQNAKSSLAGQFVAWIGAFGEYANFTKTAGLPLESNKRLVNDLNAGRSGAHLFDLFTGRSKPPTGILPQGPAYFLRPNPIYFGKSYQVTDGRPSAYFRRNIAPRFWAKVMPEDELLLRFNHAMTVDSAIINDVVISTGNGDSERLHLGLQAYIDAGMPNPILNQLILAFNPLDVFTPNPEDIIVDFDSSEWLSKTHLGPAFAEFSFEEAAVRQKRMIEKTQTAIRQKIEAAGGRVPDSRALKQSYCSAAFGVK